MMMTMSTNQQEPVAFLLVYRSVWSPITEAYTLWETRGHMLEPIYYTDQVLLPALPTTPWLARSRPATACKKTPEEASVQG
jgi:hypothetical protein